MNNPLRPALLLEADLNRVFRKVIAEFDCARCQSRKAAFLALPSLDFHCILCYQLMPAKSFPLETLAAGLAIRCAKVRESVPDYIVPACKDKDLESEINGLLGEVQVKCGALTAMIQALRQNTQKELLEDYWHIRKPFLQHLNQVNSLKAEACSGMAKDMPSLVKKIAEKVLVDMVKYNKLVPSSRSAQILTQINGFVQQFDPKLLSLQTHTDLGIGTRLDVDQIRQIESRYLVQEQDRRHEQVVVQGKWWCNCISSIKPLQRVVQLHVCST